MSAQPEVELIKIDPSNKDHLEILTKFYNEVYLEGFPVKEEALELESIILQDKMMNERDDCRHDILIAKTKDNEIVGGAIGDYFRDTNCGFLEYIVVNPKMRKLKYGTNILMQMISTMNEDSKKLVNKNNIEFLFFDAEDPEKVPDNLMETAVNRLKFWKKKGAMKVDIKYIQPGIEGKEPVTFNSCFAIPITGNQVDASVKCIDKEFMLKNIDVTFNLFFQESANEVKDIIKKSIEGKDKIDLIELP